MTEPIVAVAHWTPLDNLYRLTLALGVGLFIGLEREWRGKEAGLRTFGFVALLCGMGGLLGDNFAMLCVAMVGILVFFLNWQSLRANQGAELTTSAALLMTAIIGVFCGRGHTITPAAVGVVTAGFLAWKERLSAFSHKLTAEELRAEILLAILAFAIYPVLPDHPVDPWNLVIPQREFVTVIVIAGIGLVNYILLKIFGPKGMEITAFFGGLVNSRKVIVELTSRLQTSGAVLLPAVFKGLMLATASMLLRNFVIVVIFASNATAYCLIPFVLMLASSLLFWKFSPASATHGHAHGHHGRDGAALTFESPFRLWAAVKFALVFMALNVIGALTQRHFGSESFYFVSVLGGFLSSASSIASAATLINHHELTVATGATGVILSSLTSLVINIPLIRTMTNDLTFRRKAFAALILTAVVGLLGVGLNEVIQNVFNISLVQS